MGAITADRQHFVDELIEIVGFKTGLAIDEVRLLELLDGCGEYAIMLHSDNGGWLRLRSEAFEEIVAHLLFRLGNTRSPLAVPSSSLLHHKYKKDKRKSKIFYQVQEMELDFLRKAMEDTPEGGSIDPTEFLLAALERHGRVGAKMAFELMEGINSDLHRSPWGLIRRVEWDREVELAELFESESLETMYGTFFDQRFIDYLDQNFGDIGSIHWRKFEGLTGEFFVRQGFSVELGPGRNDDGIDLRLYPAEQDENDPSLIIVQCKRQKEKIDKALIKAVYADVLHENAKSGLIVTTSELSPGAATLRTARGYPIEDADREKLRTWIARMRTP